MSGFVPVRASSVEQAPEFDYPSPRGEWARKEN